MAVSMHFRLSPATRTWRIGFLLFAVVVMTRPPLRAEKDKPVAWKPLKEALLRVDDQPVKSWNVYAEGKKADPLLLQMGDRFLLIEIHERKVFEPDAAKIEHKGEELLWDPAALPGRPLAASGWLIKDVGFAYRVDFELTAEKRVFDLQLPHPMDLRYLY